MASKREMSKAELWRQFETLQKENEALRAEIERLQSNQGIVLEEMVALVGKRVADAQTEIVVQVGYFVERRAGIIAVIERIGQLSLLSRAGGQKTIFIQSLNLCAGDLAKAGVEFGHICL